MSKSKSKQFLNSSSEKNEKMLTSNSKLLKKPENNLEKGKIAKFESSRDGTEKKENQNKILQILKGKDKSKVSENSGFSSSKIKLKMSRISNNFSNASELKE